MLKLQTNERNDVYIFFARLDVRKLTHAAKLSKWFYSFLLKLFSEAGSLTEKFQEEAIELLREIAW